MYKSVAFVSFVNGVFAWDYDAYRKTLMFPLTREYGRLSDGTVKPLKQSVNGGDEFNMEIVDNFLMTAQVSIGTPPVTGTLLVADSTPFVTVFGQNCVGCMNTAFYDPAQSSTFQSAITNPWFNVTDWFDISLETSLGYDTVCLKGAAAGGTDLCSDNQLISMLDGFTSTITDFNTFEYNLDGAFGMGRSMNNAEGFMQRLVEEGTLAANTWSYQPSGDWSVAGSMILGGWDDAQISGEINWVPSPAANYHWNSTMTEMMIGNTTLWELSDGAIVSFVTGYKYIGVPSDVWS